MPCTQCGYELENVFVTVLKRAIAVRKLAQGLALLFAILPGISLPLGLGDIEVNTFLNQPLRAEIKLFSVRANEVADVRVKLAPAEAFDRAGVGRPYVLNQLDFTPTVNKDGQVVIAVTSKKPIREPFLNFLVRVEWPKGRLMREYTLLLDPPSFSNQPRWAGSAGASPDTAKTTQHAITDRDTGYAQTSANRRLSPDGNTETYTTQRGDTLSAIVRERMSRGGASLQQSMIAALRANPQAFVGDNINNLKTGQSLRLPAQSEVELLSREEARAEVSRQFAAWRESRLQSAASDTTQRSNNQVTRASAKSSQPSNQSDLRAEGQAGTSSQANLEILAPGDAGTRSVSGSVGESDTLGELQKKIALVQELAESRRKENKEFSSRIKELEAIVAQQDRLISLQSEEMAKLRQDMGGQQQDATASTPAAINNVTPSEAPAQSAVTENSISVQPAATPTQSAASINSEKLDKQRPGASQQVSESDNVSWLEGVAKSALPFGLAGLGVVLAVMAWWVFRGSKSSQHETTDIPHRGEFYSEPVSAEPVVPVVEEQPVRSGKQQSTMPSAAEEHASQTDAISPSPATKFQTEVSRESDPSSPASDSVITDADVYIAYGMYQEAEEGLKEVIARHPERQDYQLKLLEAYHGAQDPQGFDTLAGKLHDQGDVEAELWKRVVVMGREISPANPLYSDGRLEKDQSTQAEPTDGGGADQIEQFVPDLTPDLQGDQQAELKFVDTPQASDVSAADTGIEFDVGDLDFETEQGVNPSTESSEQKVQELDASSDELLEFNLSDSELKSLPEPEVDADLIDTTIKMRSSSKTEVGIDQEGSESALDQTGEQEPVEDRPTEILQSFMDIEAFDPLTNQDVDLLDKKAPDTFQSALDELSAESSEIEAMLGEGLEADLADSHKDTKEFDIDDRDTAILEPADEVNTKLELAQAFLEFGDSDGARSTLEEVLEEGDKEQCQRAQEILKQIA